jgi:hypothetical protein
MLRFAREATEGKGGESFSPGAPQNRGCAHFDTRYLGHRPIRPRLPRPTQLPFVRDVDSSDPLTVKISMASNVTLQAVLVIHRLEPSPGEVLVLRRAVNGVTALRGDEQIRHRVRDNEQETALW